MAVAARLCILHPCVYAVLHNLTVLICCIKVSGLSGSGLSHCPQFLHTTVTCYGYQRGAVQLVAGSACCMVPGCLNMDENAPLGVGVGW